MANNTVLDAGSGGDTFCTTDLTTFTAYSVTGKLPASAIYVGATPAPVSNANPFPISDAGGSLTVDGTVAFSNTTIAVTNAGTFVVQAAQSGTWNITNVSGTISLPTGAATAAKQPALGVAGTASADVITIQGIASMTAIKVDGSGVTQPVSGTVALAAGVAEIGNVKNSGTFAVQAVCTNAGTFAVQAAQGGTWNIGTVTTITNTVTVAGTVAFSNTTIAVTNSGTFAVQAAQSGTWTVQPGNTANTTPWLVQAEAESNVILASGVALTPKFAAVAAASSGDNTIVALVSSKKIRVLSLALIATGAVNIYLTTNAGGTVIFGGSTNKIALAANGGFVLPESNRGWFETAPGHNLVLNLSGAVAVSGGLQYCEV